MRADRPCLDAPPDGPAITAQETTAELERILSAPEFRSTERNRRFLRYVTEQMLQGREDKIKAYSIAVDVFGRPADFDPAIDPIVRIEATRLRASLVQYYEIHGQEGGLRIDLPRGRYVPAISRLDPGERTEDSGPSGERPAALDVEGRPSRLKPSFRSICAAISIAVGAGLLGGHLALAWQPAAVAFSEKPSVTIDMMVAGDVTGDAQRMRDALMVALSQFQTLRVLQPAGDSETSVDTQLQTSSTAASRRGHYRVVLKYRPGKPEPSVWWQIVDLDSGEAVISRSETVPAGESPTETLVGSLANQIAGVEGVINRIEARRGAANPALGNECVLHSYHSLRSSDPSALAMARACLEKTLERRPGDADAAGALSTVLLAFADPGDTAAMSVRALQLANRSVALAPYSASSALAQMWALYRSGRVEAAILAGRRAVALNPNDGSALAGLGGLLSITGNWQEGIPLVRKADRIDQTSNHDAAITLAMDAYRRGAFDEALAGLWQRYSAPCCDVEILRAATLGQLGRMQEAETAAEALRNSYSGFETSFRADMTTRYFEPDFIALLEDGLAKAGLHVR